MLLKLIYASQATRMMSEEDLVDLLVSARKFNTENDLTGLLMYANQSFLQVLEGDPVIVDKLYEKIEKDPRHKTLRLLSRAPVTSRKFGNWSMGFEHLDEDSLAEYLPGFQPATQYPLVNSDLVRNGTLAETLLDLYRRNKAA